MIEAAGTGQPLRRAFLRVAGKSLARHQLQLALALECEQVLCLARALEPGLIALQHEAEAAGTLFHVLNGPKDLAALVTANDELVVFSDGLLVEPEDARKLMDGGHAVLVQPSEVGIPAGFERLDLNHAGAGMMRVPGRLVEQLLDLPSDCDVASALTRIALQAGVAMREVPAGARTHGRWQLIRNESEASSIENDWLGRQLGDGRSLSPGRWLARLGVQIFGSSLLHAGNSAKVMALVTLAAMALGLGTAWLGSVASGFALCALASVMFQSAIVLQRVEGPLAHVGSAVGVPASALGWLLDLELVVLSLWATDPGSNKSLIELVFAPLMLVLLVRFVPQLRQSAWRGWLSDRMLLSLLLAGAAALGVVAGAVRLICFALAIAGIAASSGNRGILGQSRLT